MATDMQNHYGLSHMDDVILNNILLRLLLTQKGHLTVKLSGLTHQRMPTKISSFLSIRNTIFHIVLQILSCVCV